MRPVPAYVGYIFASTLEIMFVVGSWMTLVLVGVVISKYISTPLMSCMVGVSSRPRLLATMHSPDFVMLQDIKNYPFVAENVPRNLTSFGGRRDL